MSFIVLLFVHFQESFPCKQPTAWKNRDQQAIQYSNTINWRSYWWEWRFTFSLKVILVLLPRTSIISRSCMLNSTSCTLISATLNSQTIMKDHLLPSRLQIDFHSRTKNVRKHHYALPVTPKISHISRNESIEPLSFELCGSIGTIFARELKSLSQSWSIRERGKKPSIRDMWVVSHPKKSEDISNTFLSGQECCSTWDHWRKGSSN